MESKNCYSTDMENFGKEMQHVIRASVEYARQNGHRSITTTHLLFASLIECIPPLDKSDEVRKIFTDLLGPSQLVAFQQELVNDMRGNTTTGEPTGNNIPLEHIAEKVLKIAYLEAKLEKQDIRPIHVIAAILRDERSNAFSLLAKWKITYDTLRAHREASNPEVTMIAFPEELVLRIKDTLSELPVKQVAKLLTRIEREGKKITDMRY